MKYRFFILIIFLLSFGIAHAEKRGFALEDAMKFKSIGSESLSPDGTWAAYSVWPERGDGEAIFRNLEDSTVKFILPRGSRPEMARSAEFGAAIVKGPALESENADSPKDKPKDSVAVVNFRSGNIIKFSDASSFEFSNDSKWILIKKNKDAETKSKDMENKTLGSELVLRHLSSGTDIRVDFVKEYAIDSASRYLFYIISSPDGSRDGIYYRNLNENFAPEYVINAKEKNFYSSIAWNNSTGDLAYLNGDFREKGEPSFCSLYRVNIQNPSSNKLAVSRDAAPEGWFIPGKNDLKWSEDGKMLYFGFKPRAEIDTIEVKDIDFSEESFYNEDSIMHNSDIHIWHWDDGRISTNQRKWWQENKDRVFTAAYNMETNKYVQLADLELPEVPMPDNSQYAIGYDDTKYLKEITYKGWFFDLYVINVTTGERKLLQERIEERAHLSPQGKHVLYFYDKHWYQYVTSGDSTLNLTQELWDEAQIAFYDEDHDVPSNPPSYGIGGWMVNDNFVFIYDKYDIWKFFTAAPGSYVNQTKAEGRVANIRYRIRDIRPERKQFWERDTIYLEGYFYDEKFTNLFFIEPNILGAYNISSEGNNEEVPGKNFKIVAKSRDTETLMFTRESFDEFPDLWIGDKLLTEKTKLTNVNPQIDSIKWGTTEVVSWVSTTGDTLDGFIIKPEGFDPNIKYPVLVYFYEQFSYRAFNFYQPRINHRPIYQYYLADDYLIFLPDIKYYEGRPGYDATEAIVSGLEHLNTLGFIDMERLGIQGHSWAGYQGAFIISQTDIFKASCVGAPVGNMTSAYSGIRSETGLARQFQYEMYQSRIGGNLWDSLDNYLNNSPVIKAPGINTPLLILHGNDDEAVPFPQGIELYLALRRLNKNCIMVEYDKEPHHPRKYENKVDWQIRMKEFFDTYVLGKEAPGWIRDGMPYRGGLTR